VVAKHRLTPEMLQLIAERFRAMGEPVRLQLLNALRQGERTVTELVEETELGQGNVSKHLQMLHSLGFVTRRKEGLHVYYALADRHIFTLCDIMCGRLEAEADARRRVLAAR
jgi:ArsR family transcriptional regulator